MTQPEVLEQEQITECLHKSHGSSKVFTDYMIQSLVKFKISVFDDAFSSTLCMQSFLCEHCALLLTLKSNYLHSFKYIFNLFRNKNATTSSEFFLAYSVSIIVQSILFYPCIFTKFINHHNLSSVLFAWLQFLDVFWANAMHLICCKEDFTNWKHRHCIDLNKWNCIALISVFMHKMKINIMNLYIKYEYFDHLMTTRLFRFSQYESELHGANPESDNYILAVMDAIDVFVRLFVRFYLKNLKQLTSTRKMKEKLHHFKYNNWYLESKQQDLLKHDIERFKMIYYSYKKYNNKKCGNSICQKLCNKKEEWYKCGGCELIYFCGKKCQKYSWSRLNHRNICKQLKSMCNSVKIQHCPRTKTIRLFTC
eukprot:500812_1